SSLEVSQERLAFWFDVLTFFVSGVMVWTLRLPRLHRDDDGAAGVGHGLSKTVQELREGWRFITHSPRVRAVIVGLATGLVGGGMVVPLGTMVATDVVDAE